MTISDLFKADLSQAVDLSVEPVRAIARNSLAGSRRWDTPRDAPHSRVLERFANFASLFRCDAVLREIVHDLIDVPLDGAGRIWLFLSVIVHPPAHRRWTAATLRPQYRSSTRFSGLSLRLWEIFRAISSKKPARSIRDRAARQCRALQAAATVCLCDHAIDPLHHNLDMVLTGPTCTQISLSLFRPSPAAASRPARALPARARRPRWRRLW
jgi:hypothetical protein